MDMKTVFRNGDAEEAVYVNVPDCFKTTFEEHQKIVFNDAHYIA